jgi:thioredoxin-like negative regulator of GroEL
MVFNTGNQQAGIINMVAGDQTIHGGQQVTSLDQAREAVDALRGALPQVPLPPDAARAARSEADDAATELARPEPDRGRVAAALGRLVEILRRAAAVAGQVAGVVTPLTALVSWLGPHGAALAGAVTALV